jgi:SAM-dependent methyltransferase
MAGELSFDTPDAVRFVEARKAALRQLLSYLHNELQMHTALDVGCGVGYLSVFLRDLGLDVVAADGREENIQEARRRYPGIAFHHVNVEDASVQQWGTFDLVFCVGLLYHLENPFLAIRHLYSVTSKVLVVESMCAPGIEPSLQLLDEYHAENQGLNYVAFYPTESCLVKMLYRAGFPFVYGFASPPDFSLYHASRWRRKERTMLVASKERLNAMTLLQLAEPTRPWDIWAVQPGPWRMRLGRIGNLLRKFAPQARPHSKVAQKT